MIYQPAGLGIIYRHSGTAALDAVLMNQRDDKELVLSSTAIVLLVYRSH